MSSATPNTELNSGVVIARIQEGYYPREIVVTIARGFLPLPQEDLITVLAYLATSDDAELTQLAHEALKEVPLRSLIGFASNESASSDHLSLLVRATEDASVLETLIRNRAVPDAAIIDLAGRADPTVQEIIVINQLRILRAPQILDALLANPLLSAEARRRALENREEFFDKKARLEKLAEEEVAEFLPDDEIADLLVKAEAEPTPAAPPPELSQTEYQDPAKQSMFTQLLNMSVGQKVQMAFKGGKTWRTILVRDRNKLICSAVMRNPRMSEAEAEQIAGMRNVDDEVLRLISTRRDWMAKYNILIALARNPKVPIGVVVPLINRLTLRDLKGLKDDRGVSEVVRATSRKLYQQRSKKS
ncbi:MAG TPA: hypothetical protein VER58_00915 [Thermoanaerobaculia bacterium]|nr:hypothetical protein [Thermoanaerobaculia bacterium]